MIMIRKRVVRFNRRCDADGYMHTSKSNQKIFPDFTISNKRKSLSLGIRTGLLHRIGSCNYLLLITT